MARKKAAEPESVTVEYRLDELPTAQHKAGLAGLVLQIQEMREQADRGERPAEQVPEIDDLRCHGAKVRFTPASVQKLFDEVYAADVARVWVKSKWPKTEPAATDEVTETDPKTDKPKTVKRFGYDVVQPAGRLLRRHIHADPEFGWVKLWRDMLWQIPRGIPATRLPYEDTAEGRPCREGSAAWAALVRFDAARAAGGFCTDAVSSALWLGAQANNAELIPFAGRVEQTLLLHFWPLTTLIFVPQVIDSDGETEFVGYSLAIPEVADLTRFCRDYPQLLSDLPEAVRGYRPASAVVDLPAQSALDFMLHLARLVGRKAERSTVADLVASVEYMHLVKAGNTVRTMAAGRVVARPGLLPAYEDIVGREDRPAPCRNPLFRAALIRALLDGRPWYDCFAGLFAGRPWPFFVRGERTPDRLPWFSADAAERFRTEWQLFNQKREAAVSQPTEAAPLPLLVHRMIQTYVSRKVKERSGLEWGDFRDKKVKDEETGRERVEVPAAYREAREKVVSDAFLSMRSRREQDFVDFFTASVCSVGQFLPAEDYKIVAEALLTRPEDVKTLSLLALSANS